MRIILVKSLAGVEQKSRARRLLFGIASVLQPLAKTRFAPPRQSPQRADRRIDQSWATGTVLLSSAISATAAFEHIDFTDRVSMAATRALLFLALAAGDPSPTVRPTAAPGDHGAPDRESDAAAGRRPGDAGGAARPSRRRARP